MLEDATLRKAVELAVTTEKLGAGFYKGLAERFSDNEELSELFSTLSRDEVQHEREFSSLLKKIPAGSEADNQSEKAEYLKAVSLSQFFAGQGPLKDIDKIETRDDALNRAFSLEKATLLYYHGIRDILGENEVLQAIIDAEKSHLVSVMKYLITDAKMRGLSDKW